jgi:hypothetical protein
MDAIVPKSPYFTISDVISSTVNPTLSVTVIDNSGTKSGTFSINNQQGNINVGILGGEYLVQGSLNGVTSFYTNKIFYNGTTYSYVQACDANIPATGAIGDIQGSSPNVMNTGNSGTFIYPTNLISYTGGSQAVTWTVPGSGYQNSKSLINSGAFPYTLNGGTIMSSGTEVIHRFTTGNQPINFFLTFSNYQIALVTSVPCPSNMNLVNITACQNCQSSSTINILIDNNCLSGSVQFYFEDTSITILNPSQTIGNGKSISLAINFQINKNYSSTSLCFTSTEGNNCIATVIRAPYQIDLRNNTEMISQGFNTTGNVAFDSFLNSLFSPVSSLFNLPTSLTNNIIWFVVTGVLIIIGIILIVLLLRCIIKKANSSKATKENIKKTD